ncbi:hypothetical protein E3N88_07339 [Mikania micrantha]|uniref:Uncharacterized protein n=1 Tax=Mikania micrantha TaxID=192012 RepID=A0A5N6PR99_9ASTR|nr:hypothetical protein E3N88_07339 [Mikania micrantha]
MSALRLVDEDVVPETHVVPKVVLGISAIASPSEKQVKLVGEPSSGMLLETEMGAAEERARALNEEVERYAHELQCQQVVNDSIMHDNECQQEKLRVLEGKVEMAHEFLDEKHAALDSAQDDLMTSRVEVARLQEEVQGLRVKVQRLGVSQRTLVRDWEWLVAEGCQRVFERIRGSNEYVQLLGDVNSACMAVGYQNGLRAGYKYAAQGTVLEDSTCYDPTAQQWMTDATLALAAVTPSILSQLAATPHISLDEFQALTSVVDPNTPGV